MLAGKGWSEATEKPDFIPPLENGLNISSNYRYTRYDDETGSEFPMVVDYDSAWLLAQIYIKSLYDYGQLPTACTAKYAAYDPVRMVWFFRLNEKEDSTPDLDGVCYTLAISAKNGEFLSCLCDDPV